VSLLVAVAFVAVPSSLGFVRAFVPVALALTSTALPLLVALTEVGLASGIMLPENAAVVGAGALSVAVFPLVAVKLGQRAGTSAARVVDRA
jgi:hypothetical protein